MKNKYTGLTESEVINNQKLYGKNIIIYEEKNKLIRKVLPILKQPIVLILLICLIIYLILGEITYAIIIGTISIIILVSNIYQQIKYTKTIEFLKRIKPNTCKVIRDNKETVINSEDITIDDVIILNEGDKVSADAIILESNNLYVDESILIKDNINMPKSYDLLDKDAILKSNYVYKETLIVKGSGIAKVTNIGNKTEYSKINTLDKKESNSNLEKQINKLYKTLTIIALIMSIIVGGISTINNNIVIAILSGIIMMVASIPIITSQTFRLIIYKSLYKFSTNNAIIKDIANIENISKITCLCVDKIGFITENKMEVKDFYSSIDDKEAIFNCIMASNKNSKEGVDEAIWDYAFRNDVKSDEEYKLIKKYPFNRKTKMMANVYEYNDELYIFVKGALNSLFDICDLDVEEKYKLHNFQKQLYKKGLHVMAFASQKIETIEKDIFKYNINFNGILGLRNIPKHNVKETIGKFKKSGIKIIMMTKDNEEISTSIGKQTDIYNYQNVLTGKEIDNMSDDELSDKIKNIGIISKMLKKHKTRIINALKNNNEIVAITGDSVNDLNALKNADIGVSGSGIGTEAFNEFADLIILNNNFETIVNTIKATRIICGNIKKLIKYILVINIMLIILSLILTLFNYLVLILPLCIIILKMLLEIICFSMLKKETN